MKLIIFYIMMLFFLVPAFSQQGPSKKTDSVSAKVIAYLKNKQPDSIYAMTGKIFREKITAENFEAILINKIFPSTNFKDIRYINTKEGISKYKIEANPPLQLLIGLDTDNKIEVFLIQEYVTE